MSSIKVEFLTELLVIALGIGCTEKVSKGIYRCVLASLYEGLSVNRSVCRSVCRSVRPSVGPSITHFFEFAKSLISDLRD